MMPDINFGTVLSWIQAGGTLVQEGAALYNELKGAFSTGDQATLDAEVVASTAAADQAFKNSQG